MEVRYTKAAFKAMGRSNKASLIRRKIEQLADDRESLSANVVRLTGSDDFRLRVQDWRVIFRLEAEMLVVKAVLPRGAAYEDKK